MWNYLKVVCRELGWGPPVEVAGYANDFLGSLSGLSCHVVFKVVDMSGGGKPLYLRLGVCKNRSGFGSEMHNFHDFFGNLWWPSQNCFHEPLGRPTYTLLWQNSVWTLLYLPMCGFSHHWHIPKLYGRPMVEERGVQSAGLVALPILLATPTNTLKGYKWVEGWIDWIQFRKLVIPERFS